MPLILRGEIRAGKSNFSYWLDKLQPFYTSKTGMPLFPGTLNVHLASGSFRTPESALRLEKEEYGGRKRNVIWIAAGEDSLALDVHPRIKAAGGDAARVFCSKGFIPRLPADIPLL